MRKYLQKNKFRKAISVILGGRCTEFGYFLPTDYNINEGLINLEFAMLTSYWDSLEKIKSCC